MTDDEIAAELKKLSDDWGKLRAELDEGHGGSPGEWMVERMGALETEQKRRVHAAAGLCAWAMNTCNQKRLKGLTFCRRHQPYPA